MLYKDYVERKTANAIRINSAEGYPCEFDNSKGRPLKDYKLYGNSIQDGTPTPDNPVEVQSVGDLTTKNLLPYPYSNTTQTVNGVTWTDNGDGTITASGTATDYTDFSIVQKKQEVIQPNKEYVFSHNGTDAKNVAVDIILYDKDGKFTRYVKPNSSFTTAENEELITIYLKRRVLGYSVGGTFKPQLEEGSTATEYEPYHKYDIPIVVNDTTTHIYLDDVPLRKVGNYADYIDFKHQKVVRNTIRRSLRIDDIHRKLKNVIRFGCVGPFGKCDYHMRSTIFRNYKGFALDQETVFHHPTSPSAYYWSVYWHRLGLTYDGTNVYRTDDAEQTPLTDSEIINIANKWLNTLSAKDREVYIILDTPTKKSTTLPALKTFKGTNIISVDTNISPSNIQVQYIER